MKLKKLIYKSLSGMLSLGMLAGPVGIKQIALVVSGTAVAWSAQAELSGEAPSGQKEAASADPVVDKVVDAGSGVKHGSAEPGDTKDQASVTEKALYEGRSQISPDDCKRFLSSHTPDAFCSMEESTFKASVQPTLEACLTLSQDLHVQALAHQSLGEAMEATAAADAGKVKVVEIDGRTHLQEANGETKEVSEASWEKTRVALAELEASKAAIKSQIPYPGRLPAGAEDDFVTKLSSTAAAGATTPQDQYQQCVDRAMASADLANGGSNLTVADSYRRAGNNPACERVVSKLQKDFKVQLSNSDIKKAQATQGAYAANLPDYSSAKSTQALVEECKKLHLGEGKHKKKSWLTWLLVLGVIGVVGFLVYNAVKGGDDDGDSGSSSRSRGSSSGSSSGGGGGRDVASSEDHSDHQASASSSSSNNDNDSSSSSDNGGCPEGTEQHHPGHCV